MPNGRAGHRSRPGDRTIRVNKQDPTEFLWRENCKSVNTREGQRQSLPLQRIREKKLRHLHRSAGLRGTPQKRRTLITRAREQREHESKRATRA